MKCYQHGYGACSQTVYVDHVKANFDLDAITNSGMNLVYDAIEEYSTFRSVYTQEELVEMNRNFRLRFNTDLSKVSIQAYDLTTYFSCHFFGLNAQCKALMNDFNPVQIDKGDGFENRSVFIVEQENFELIKKAIVAQ